MTRQAVDPALQNDGLVGHECLVCGRPAAEPFVNLSGVPVNPNALWRTAADARAAPRGDIALVHCPGCELIWNTAFDPDLLAYDQEYENSLHFSGVFQRYSEELTARLVDTYSLGDAHVAELGCGKGEFLSLLCERGGCTGIGFDPSYAGECDGRADGRLTFVRELFDAGTALGDPDLVISRHVVEHLDDPVGVLRMVRDALGEHGSTLYIEVPAAEYLLQETALWDIIYPHVTCFSAVALENLLERVGFHPHARGYALEDQYLWVEASTAGPGDRGRIATASGEAAASVLGFAHRMDARRAHWAERLPRLAAERPIVVWGAGAKGVTFLNIVPGAESIEAVVDLNPRKHGKFVPGTGQRIVAPASLVGQGPMTVVTLNPVYAGEIAELLRELDIVADVLVA